VHFQYQMDDLTDLCDVHLHRVVRRDNVQHILTLAKRHNLKRTLAKLEKKLSEWVHAIILRYNRSFAMDISAGNVW